MKKATLWIILSLVGLSGWAHADDSSSVIGFVAKDGLYVSGDIGVFASFKGSGAQVLSTIQPLVGLALGYDFGRYFGLSLKLASASVSNGALSLSDPESPTDFGLYLVDANAMGAISLTNRIRLTINGFGGITIMSPAPTIGASSNAYNLGASIGVLYDTLLADMVVGLNVAGYAFLNVDAPVGGKRTFFAASITPVLKYVF